LAFGTEEKQERLASSLKNSQVQGRASWPFSPRQFEHRFSGKGVNNVLEYDTLGVANLFNNDLQVLTGAMRCSMAKPTSFPVHLLFFSFLASPVLCVHFLVGR